MEINDDYIDQEIKKRVASLDNLYPADLPHPDKIWETILLKKKRQHSIRIRTTWSIAASVIFLLVTVVVWRIADTNHDKIVEQPPHESIAAPKDEALEYIKRFCSGNNVACATPAFQELQQELETSSSKLSEVNKQLSLFGNDSQLLRAKERIETHQARIIKAMVQTL